jgi:hypothetical protein
MMNLNRINELLEDHQPFHSELQMDRFIIAQNGITHYGMYKQALRELAIRYEGLVIQVDRLLKSRPDAKKKWNRLIEAEHTELNWITLEQMNIRIHLRDLLREFIRFYQIAEYLKDELGELTPAKRMELDRDYWKRRLALTAAVDVLYEGRVSRSTYDAIMALDAKLKGELVDFIQNKDLVQYALTHQIHVPKVEPTELEMMEAWRSLYDPINRSLEEPARGDHISLR